MNPVVNLPSDRRGRDDKINYTLCLLCQTRTKKKLRCASEAGMSRIKQALNDKIRQDKRLLKLWQPRSWIGKTNYIQ